MIEEREALNLFEPLFPLGATIIYPSMVLLYNPRSPIVNAFQEKYKRDNTVNGVSELLTLDRGLKCKYSCLCCSAALFTLAYQSEAANGFRVREHRPLKTGSSSTGASTNIRRKYRRDEGSVSLLKLSAA